MMGINQRKEDLDYSMTMICDICGQYGRYNVFMVFNVLTLFFIPIFKWDYRYYVQTSCCSTVYELDPSKGKAIRNGEHPEITAADLTVTNRGSYHQYKKCTYCGYETEEDFEYCPKCGNRF